MKKQLHQLSIKAVGVTLLLLGTWSQAPTQATTIKADFFADLNQVNANVPGVEVGTIVSGSILYQKVPNQEAIPLDFTLSIGSNKFTFDDLVEIRVFDFESTAGFDTQATLKTREGLGDWSQGFAFEIFQEFGDSNLFLNSIFREPEFSADSIGGLNLKRQEVTPIPEPDLLVGTAVAGAMCLCLNRKRKYLAHQG